MGFCVEADTTGVHVIQRCCAEVLELENHCGGARTF